MHVYDCHILKGEGETRDVMCTVANHPSREEWIEEGKR